MTIHDRQQVRGARTMRALRALLIVLAVAVGGSMTAGPHGLPLTAGHATHSHALEHSGPAGHHHVGEEDLQRRGSSHAKSPTAKTRRRRQERRPMPHPVWRRVRLRAPPRRWAKMAPPTLLSVRLRICLIRV